MLTKALQTPRTGNSFWRDEILSSFAGLLIATAHTRQPLKINQWSQDQKAL